MCKAQFIKPCERNSKNYCERLRGGGHFDLTACRSECCAPETDPPLRIQRQCRALVISRSHGARLENPVLFHPIKGLLEDLARVRLEDDSLAGAPAPRFNAVLEALGKLVPVV